MVRGKPQKYPPDIITLLLSSTAPRASTETNPAGSTPPSLPPTSFQIPACPKNRLVAPATQKFRSGRPENRSPPRSTHPPYLPAPAWHVGSSNDPFCGPV